MLTPPRSRRLPTVLLQVAALALGVACSQAREDTAQTPQRTGSGPTGPVNGTADSGAGTGSSTAGTGSSSVGANGTDSGAPISSAPVAAMIGPEGGMLMGPSGSSVHIPEGALEEEVEISVSVAAEGFGPLPALANGAIFAFEPHGQVFAQPVTISVPHGGNPAEIALFTSEVGSDWVKLNADIDASLATVEVSHFSFFFNGREVCGLDRQECCTSADGADGECSGDALVCIDGRCMECGFNGEPCCADSTCHEANNTCEVSPDYGARCVFPAVGPGGGAAGGSSM